MTEDFFTERWRNFIGTTAERERLKSLLGAEASLEKITDNSSRELLMTLEKSALIYRAICTHPGALDGRVGAGVVRGLMKLDKHALCNMVLGSGQ